MKRQEYAKGNRIFLLSLWVIPIAFYLAFWALDGAVWCADSESYVRMHDCREPLYPTILALLRFVCGVGEDADPEHNISLTVMALLQSILAGVATGSVTTFMVRYYLKDALYDGTLHGRRMHTAAGKASCMKARDRERLIAYVVMAVPLMVSLLNRFAAGRASMYSNSIMTEGLAISIYMLAFRFILQYMLEGGRYAFIMSAVCVVLGISTRKQMYVLLCLLLIAVFYRDIIKGRGRRLEGVLLLILTCVMTVGINILIDCSYNKIVRDAFIIHTEDNRFVTTMALYTSERDYVQYIEPELKDIYLKIYDVCDENNWLMHDAPSGWLDATEHFADNYDHIQLDTMQLMLEDYVEEEAYSGFAPGMTETQKIDSIRASMNESLIIHETDRLLRVFFYNLLNGLVNTVAKKNLMLCVYSAVIYTVFIILSIRMRKESGFGLLAIMTMLAIVGNVTLVSAVIFCQTRYCIYNMPIFYIALIIMIYSDVSYRRIDRQR